MDSGVETPREISVKEITADTDTRDILERARKMGKERDFDDKFIVDIDSHHVETESWAEMAEYIEDEVIKFQAVDHLTNRTGSPPYGLNGDLALERNWSLKISSDNGPSYPVARIFVIKLARSSSP